MRQTLRLCADWRLMNSQLENNILTLGISPRINQPTPEWGPGRNLTRHSGTGTREQSQKDVLKSVVTINLPDVVLLLSGDWAGSLRRSKIAQHFVFECLRWKSVFVSHHAYRSYLWMTLLIFIWCLFFLSSIVLSYPLHACILYRDYFCVQGMWKTNPVYFLGKYIMRVCYLLVETYRG